MSYAVKEAMKMAEVKYEIKDKPAKEQPVVRSVITKKAEAVTDFNQEASSKLSRYTAEDFVSSAKDDIKEAMENITQHLNNIKRSTMSADPMALFPDLKQIDELCATVGKLAIPYANRQYISGNFSLPDAKIGKYSPRRKWKYSKELTEEAALIDAKKKIEQESGTAKDVSPPVDVTKQKLFTISLKK